jgi:hypothetical protein
MKQRLSIIVASAALGLSPLGAVPERGPGEVDCSGRLPQDSRTIYCTSTNPYGNDEHSQSKKTTTTTTTKKGSEQSSHPKESSCDGNKGQCKNQK